MKLLKAQWMIAGAALLASNVASAELYGGVNYMAAELEVGSTDFDLGALYGRFGSQFNENLSGELRVGVGVSDDEVLGFNVEIDKYFGGYVRGSVPLNDGIMPYIIVGITDVDIDTDAGSDSDEDLSYGIGLDFKIDNQLMLNLEYMNMYDDDDVEITGLSIGAAATF
ncbi:MAG: porin family protein [Ketobacteraceae bacterium]|nr:porin family protein [Ketobacteraceae bacterium]